MFTLDQRVMRKFDAATGTVISVSTGDYRPDGTEAVTLIGVRADYDGFVWQGTLAAWEAMPAGATA